MPSESEIKNFLSRAIFAALVGAAIAFAVSMTFDRKWQVSARIVVFPSGKPLSAAENLAVEVGNTAWIVNSDTFQKRNFGDFSADFSGAEVVKNSSMVLVKFKSTEENIEAVEDLLVKIPGQADEYARDLYDGSPFKYKLAGDPEISARPVEPDILGGVERGFAIGLALYILYWLTAGSFAGAERKTEKESETIPVSNVASPEFSFESVRKKSALPIFKPAPAEKKTVVPEKSNVAAPAGSAPSNLPIAENSSASEYQEPSDEEVKDRLNKLMRGEL